jgi:hypothetical protein
VNWFRLYHDLIDDPKVQRLEGRVFKVWINLLCLASRSDPRGVLPDHGDLAFALRIEEEEAEETIRLLLDKGLLEEVDGALMPHNWDGRQFRSDDVASRVKRSRVRQEEVASLSAPKDKPEQVEEGGTKPVKPKGTRGRGKTVAPETFEVGAEQVEYAASLGFSGEEVGAQTMQFLDYHRAKGSQFSDWHAAWRNWLRNARRFADERVVSRPASSRMTEDEYWAKVAILVDKDGGG